MKTTKSPTEGKSKAKAMARSLQRRYPTMQAMADETDHARHAKGYADGDADQDEYEEDNQNECHQLSY